ncbi:MAG: hypothetical protein Q7V62_04870 [Actinomycetota bacterium]|nr:hypothetical protein [Actinomycetota bacterium]
MVNATQKKQKSAHKTGSKSGRAGLAVSAGKIKRLVRSTDTKRRLGGDAPIYLAGVLQAKMLSITKAAIKESRATSKPHKETGVFTTTPEHANLAINRDPLLRKLLRRTPVPLPYGKSGLLHLAPSSHKKKV